ncbi:Bug family tripartite tricarboxylate transporter substrate binding protein [Nocardiopsis suaedae]|uniref:Tripartite tricarboxylate transporter substrate binding protein n=1 Tax=Nocardiopsis suaedae TaxID=3018444 RepID=A0ABT4TW79_9ACTN|nr:tripartite tricarboxylate transporter substrate binding protein [Nocardiopsis suaedae]MDA2808392.1 tripartite tricarboxylate transporter substrate binding protein [Nocardiopsis suaedae]
MPWSPRSRGPLTAVAAGGLCATLAACGAVTDGSAGGGSYPSGPISMVVGQDAGGSTDRIARAVADGSKGALGVSMPVENQPGANGAIATQQVAESDPDGQRIVLLNASLMTITSLVVPEEEAVTLDDLDVVMGLSRDDYIMVANADTGYETVEDVVADSGDITYGTAGIGTGSQLAQLLLFDQAGIEGREVPFDSGSPALTAVMGGQVDVATIQVGEAMPQIEAGTITPITIFSEERNAYLEDVPTAKEEGYDVPVAQYRAVALPEGAPKEVKDTLRKGLEEITASEEYKRFNEENYLTPVEISGEEVEKEWARLADEYAQQVEESGLELGEAGE